MRVAALYDIHANLPALEAVLAEVYNSRVDHIVVGGDVFPGPMPSEVLDLLRDQPLPIEFLFGNGDVALQDSTSVSEPFRPAIDWAAKQLDDDARHFVTSWPKTLRLHIEGLGDILFCHATPRYENEIFTATTDDAALIAIFDAAGADVVVCGHTHMQFDRMVGRTRVVNAGSIGMPFGPAGADWLLIDSTIEFRHTDYDLDQAAERIRKTAYPGADSFAANYVVKPPSAAKMLEVFTRSELKSA